jgi:TetR/AcrR family transcriptional regulator
MAVISFWVKPAGPGPSTNGLPDHASGGPLADHRSRATQWRQRIATNAQRAAREAAADRAISRAERLIAATRQLIAETGTTSFTVQDIARRANMSLSAVYTYFAGKDELLLAVLEEAIRGASDRLRAQLDTCDDPIDRLRTAIVGPLLYAVGPQRPADVTALSRERDRLSDLFPVQSKAATDQLVEILRDELATAAEAGLLTPLDPARDATAIYNLWTTQLRDLRRSGQLGEPAEINAAADYLWQICRRFLRIRGDKPSTSTRGFS